jgi:hypothetical protein
LARKVGGALTNSTAFSCKYNAYNPASMPATLCLQFAESVLEQTWNRNLTGAANDDISSGLQGRCYLFLPIQSFAAGSRTTISRHFPQTKPTSANEANGEKANNIKQFQS